MKNQKELVIKIVWRGTLSVLALIAIVNTLYFGITDTLVLGNQFFMMGIVCAPVLVGLWVLGWGLYQAIIVFLRDTQNYLDRKPFAGYFWKPLVWSLISFAFGFLCFVFAFAFFCLMQEPVIVEAPHVFTVWIESAYDAARQMYLLAYGIAGVFAGGMVVQKKLI